MNRKLLRFDFRCRSLSLVALVLCFATAASAGWNEKVLYSFQSIPDGAYPAGGVVFDKSGNLYGATTFGGRNDTGYCFGLPQCGTVYQVRRPVQKGKPWTETVLYAFKGVNHNDGNNPEGGVLLDKDGNVYGTTAYGGAGKCQLFGSRVGCGIVFELTPPARKGGAWTETILYSFQNANDGYIPVGSLVSDALGNLYGATLFGGGKGTNCDSYYGGNCGTVFELSPPRQKGGKWKEKVLYSFTGGSDGGQPNGGLVLDSKGTIYGTTYYGGNESGRCAGVGGSVGCGTVFAVRPPNKKGAEWTQRVLHRFDIEHAYPAAGVILGPSGELYGTTTWSPNGNGLVFELKKPAKGSHTWTENVLHQFTGGFEGSDPVAALLLGAHGDLYGTTYLPGGAVFRLRPKGGKWTFNTLYGFEGLSSGAEPRAGVILDRLGNIYGTTEYGGNGPCGYAACGVVFEVSP